MNLQKKIGRLSILLLSLGLFAGCESGGGLSASLSSSAASSSSAVEKVDYSQGRAMNRKLGKGINFGNSWESNGNGCLDACWSNPIADDDFKLAKDAGFNSIRLPVNWNRTASNEPPYTVEPERLAGVKRHIQLAIDQGLPVITNIHHFDALYNADTPENRQVRRNLETTFRSI